MICKQAALRAYRELSATGAAGPAAFNAAVAVYRHHHPETPGRESDYIVAGWIEERDALLDGTEMHGSA